MELAGMSGKMDLLTLASLFRGKNKERESGRC